MDSNRITDIFLSFREVNQSMHHAIWNASEDLGLTPIQLMVLKILDKTPQIGVSELADCLFVGNSATSGIVDRMVKMGLLIRERGERDRRSVRLRITHKGEELYNQANERRMQMMEPLMQMDESDVNELIKIHKKIVALLEKTENLERG
ncbi:MarR family winged helix-turn-helix transcriptional regulator [Cohnella sp. AR92]|uniref:MarR family winged helix-turn-helix transcriptional regulator n=1 Tax=Cohnella sp. AR92 TaxID=648716 RepID=UPI000F8CB585|nr:MarR family transcriptional regulator [Cohnella sp. AR92]RUS46428.1 MarR family transcriptional regulator [Cohnella sp. AR92]